MNKKNIYTLIIILILGLGLLAYFLWPRLSGEDGGGPVILGSPKLEIYMGNIEAVERDKIILKVGVVPLLGDQQEFDFIDFQINEKTEFYRYTDTIKSKEEFNKEQEEFNKEVAKFKEQGKSIFGLAAPSWYIIKEIVSNELIKGQPATIYSYQQAGNNMASKIVVEREKRSAQVLPDPLALGAVRIELFGIIEEIKDNSLVLNEYNPHPAATSTFIGLKEIFIDNTTKIIKKAQKTRAQFQKEQDEFNKKVEQLGSEGKDIFNANISAPSWFIEQEIKLSDLVVGRDIAVLVIQVVESGKMVAREIESKP